MLIQVGTASVFVLLWLWLLLFLLQKVREQCVQLVWDFLFLWMREQWLIRLLRDYFSIDFRPFLYLFFGFVLGETAFLLEWPGCGILIPMEDCRLKDLLIFIENFLFLHVGSDQLLCQFPYQFLSVHKLSFQIGDQSLLVQDLLLQQPVEKLQFRVLVHLPLDYVTILYCLVLAKTLALLHAETFAGVAGWEFALVAQVLRQCFFRLGVRHQPVFELSDRLLKTGEFFLNGHGATFLGFWGFAICVEFEMRVGMCGWLQLGEEHLQG